ncbi:hypothetical protein BT69DRAFT_1319404 [Atractiella rhizophila]|nr:hypothetical protein BT69DRAFT_1319404 [Atractiella rhizophila]
MGTEGRMDRLRKAWEDKGVIDPSSADQLDAFVASRLALKEGINSSISESAAGTIVQPVTDQDVATSLLDALPDHPPWSNIRSLFQSSTGTPSLDLSLSSVRTAILSASATANLFSHPQSQNHLAQTQPSLDTFRQDGEGIPPTPVTGQFARLSFARPSHPHLRSRETSMSAALQRDEEEAGSGKDKESGYKASLPTIKESTIIRPLSRPSTSKPSEKADTVIVNGKSHLAYLSRDRSGSGMRYHPYPPVTPLLPRFSHSYPHRPSAHAFNVNVINSNGFVLPTLPPNMPQPKGWVVIHPNGVVQSLPNHPRPQPAFPPQPQPRPHERVKERLSQPDTVNESDTEVKMEEIDIPPPSLERQRGGKTRGGSSLGSRSGSVRDSASIGRSTEAEMEDPLDEKGTIAELCDRCRLKGLGCTKVDGRRQCEECEETAFQCTYGKTSTRLLLEASYARMRSKACNMCKTRRRKCIPNTKGQRGLKEPCQACKEAGDAARCYFADKDRRETWNQRISVSS